MTGTVRLWIIPYTDKYIHIYMYLLGPLQHEKYMQALFYIATSGIFAERYVVHVHVHVDVHTCT